MRNILFVFAVVSMVLTTNINSARADADPGCDGACFDQMSGQVCSKAIEHNRCLGTPSSVVCCPAGGTVSAKTGGANPGGAGIRIEKIEWVWGGEEDFKDGVVTVAWDRNLAEKPVRIGFKTAPTGQVVRVAEGGRDPFYYGVDVAADVWYTLGEGNHGVLNTCVVMSGQVYGFTPFGPIEVKREKAPQQNKLIKATILPSQMNPAPPRIPEPTPAQLQAAVAGNGDQLDRIEGGVTDLRTGASAKFMRVLAATAGGAVLGAVLGAAFADTTLGGASTGGAIGAGVGLAAGALWSMSIEW